MAETPPSKLAALTAEAHRLYAVLNPTGPVQVLIPAHERPKMEARYKVVFDELTALGKTQNENRAQVTEWLREVEDALPSLVQMLPGDMKPRMEKLVGMPEGKEREAEIVAVLNHLVNGDALKRLGPAGLMIRPMIQKMLRKAKK